MMPYLQGWSRFIGRPREALGPLGQLSASAGSALTVVC